MEYLDPLSCKPITKVYYLRHMFWPLYHRYGKKRIIKFEIDKTERVATIKD